MTLSKPEKPKSAFEVLYQEDFGDEETVVFSNDALREELGVQVKIEEPEPDNADDGLKPAELKKASSKLSIAGERLQVMYEPINAKGESKAENIRASFMDLSAAGEAPGLFKAFSQIFKPPEPSQTEATTLAVGDQANQTKQVGGLARVNLRRPGAEQRQGPKITSALGVRVANTGIQEAIVEEDEDEFYRPMANDIQPQTQPQPAKETSGYEIENIDQKLSLFDEFLDTSAKLTAQAVETQAPSQPKNVRTALKSDLSAAALKTRNKNEHASTENLVGIWKTRQVFETPLKGEILCGDLFLGSRYLLGTTKGMYEYQKKTGQMTLLVPKKVIHGLKVITEFGVVVCLIGTGKRKMIQLYGLTPLAKASVAISKGAKKVPLKPTPMPDSKGCNSFTVTKIKKDIFMTAAVKKSVVLYMWSEKPHNTFMAVQEFPTPEECYKVLPIIRFDARRNPRVTHMCAMLTYRFVMIDVDSLEAAALRFNVDLPSRARPTVLERWGDQKLVLGFTDVSFVLDLKTEEIDWVAVEYEVPLCKSGVALPRKQFLALGGFTQIYSLHSGGKIQDLGEIPRKLSRFLVKDKKDYIVSARMGKKGKESVIYNVYLT
eukprot:NODE_120_length_2215_cov_86.034483_g97_i0.p1 GENE.NODE_120_length_2215_cov_86.034483_g97_i0~~NODE_120_length_2215_cov_86.034483_g97_i0.p1  ORF type:complete len:703 (+),score=151.31 NODE_120_length_2215_cov_86.034483_g97_i0:298-2109(+)